jgi:hypothetical protein
MMSTHTLFDEHVHSGEPAGHTPRVELDVPSALSAVRIAGLQVVPDARGGTLLDVGHPGLAPLSPYLSATGTWMWVTDLPGVAAARRTPRPADTVVLDGRAQPRESARDARADLVVLPIDQIEPRRAQPPGPAALLDLTDLPQYRIRPRMLAAPAEVAGFHLDLTEVPISATQQHMDTLGHALRRWHVAGRYDRPLLVLRGTHALRARWAVNVVKRVSRTGGMHMPVVRVDVTPTVLSVAVRTVVRVLAVDSHRGQPVLQVDGLPSATCAPLQVLEPGRTPTAPVDVLLRHHGRMVPARIDGGAVKPGSEIAAPGWTEIDGYPVVRGFPTTQTG